MNNTIRYILAGMLIFLIILFQPVYLKWLGYDDGSGNVKQNGSSLLPPDHSTIVEKGVVDKLVYDKDIILKTPGNDSFITISTPLYTATLINRSGGSFINYTLVGEGSSKLKYLGGYDEDGSYRPNLPVSIIMSSGENCMPCLAYFDDRNNKYIFINQPFTLLNYSSTSDTIFLDIGDSIELRYSLLNTDGQPLIKKSVIFSGDE